MAMEATPIYKDPHQPIEARVQDLISRMTLAEKIGQMTQIERAVATPSAIRDLAIGNERSYLIKFRCWLPLSEFCTTVYAGSILSGGGSAPTSGASAKDWVDMVDRFQKSALESRLSIPMVYGVDAVHGHNNVVGATIFPHNIGLGATRDADLVQKIAEATAKEVRATGIPYNFAPCVAVCRDPRWGRCFESFSEDCELVRSMTTAVRGLQGSPPEVHPKGYPYVGGRSNVIACAKHYVGDGGTDGGVNEGNTLSSFEHLESVHLRPFLDCFSLHVSTVMASFSSWNGTKLHCNYYLITELLKEQLGFKGFVISDWGGIDKILDPPKSDYRYCISASINAGMDMVMVPFLYEEFIKELTSLVESGEIPMARINDAVERILRVKFISGLFEHPFADRSLLQTVGCETHRKLAREAVRKSLVLLKNGKDPEKPFLPLDKNAKRVLVVGQHADDIGYQCGGWTISWAGSSGKITEGTTILEAIKKTVSEHTEVIYEVDPSPEIFNDSEFSFAIVVVGEEPYVENLGDNSVLDIPLNGAELIRLVGSKVPTLVIMISGRPLVVEQVLDNMEAFVAAWLPGTECDGITDVIFGDYEFHGTLPRTWFKRVDQLPMNVGDSNYDPLFPFGFGLKMNLEKQDTTKQ
ncbi:Beta-glucosidase [Nymphaea thermarum]|nr:Beta-glucosidase [Nymphaea thermarum]